MTDLDCDHDSLCPFALFVEFCQKFHGAEALADFEHDYTPAQLAEFKEAFQFYDEDNDGKINRWACGPHGGG